jgi:hypothetical protein
MSTGSERRLPLAPVNLVLCGVMALAAVVTLIIGQWQEAVVVVIALAIMVVQLRRARRPDASDVRRVDAMEYRDERDRVIGTEGLAVVGAAAMILTMVEYVVALALHRWVILPLGQMVLLAVVWTVANRVASWRH